MIKHTLTIKNIFKIALIAFLTFGFVYFYKKSQNLQKENFNISQNYETLRTQFLVQNNINFYE